MMVRFENQIKKYSNSDNLMFFTILFACIIMIFTYEFMPYILDKINLELELSNYPKENKLIQIFVLVNGAHIFGLK